MGRRRARPRRGQPTRPPPSDVQQLPPGGRLPAQDPGLLTHHWSRRGPRLPSCRTLQGRGAVAGQPRVGVGRRGVAGGVRGTPRGPASGPPWQRPGITRSQSHPPEGSAMMPAPSSLARSPPAERVARGLADACRFSGGCASSGGSRPAAWPASSKEAFSSRGATYPSCQPPTGQQCRCRTAPWAGRWRSTGARGGQRGGDGAARWAADQG